MADYPGDLLTFSSPFLILPPVSDHVVIDPSKPSAVRVLGKSMYVLAVGWFISIGWLWVATLQQHHLDLALRRLECKDATDNCSKDNSEHSGYCRNDCWIHALACFY